MAITSLADYTSGTYVDLSSFEGPPDSGSVSYVVGNWGLDRAGSLWYCITSGIGAVSDWVKFGNNVTVNFDTSGGGAVSVTANQGTPNSAANGWPVKVTDGTTVASVIAGDSGNNSLGVGSTRKELAGLSAGSLNADLVPSTDVSNWRSFSIHIEGTYSGTLSFQGSNDNTNWRSITVEPEQSTSPINLVTTTTASGQIYSGEIRYRYLRIRMTSYTSGTATGVLELFSFGRASQIVATTLANNATNTNATSTPNTAPVYSFGMGYNGTTWDLLQSRSSNNDGVGVVAQGIPTQQSYPMGYNGVSWDRLRTSNTFKTATATASGDTALWTPTSGKKFRLISYQIQVTADAALAVGADLDIVLRDATTGLAFSFSVFIPGVAATTFGNSANTGWITVPNGYLSTTINNVLNINLSAALTSGKVRVVAVGTEE